MDDEAGYSIDFSMEPDHPDFYSDPGTNNDVDLAAAGGPYAVRKFVTRLDSVSQNPITWAAEANDAGVGLADDSATVTYRVYRDSETEPATWTESTVTSFTSSNVLDVEAYALSSIGPELFTHDGNFTIELRACDHLGNYSSDFLVGTWEHHPLAPPLEVEYDDKITASDADHYVRSLHRMSMTPNATQQELAEAMYRLDPVPPGGLGRARAIGSFVVSNPHEVPVQVGFFVPAPQNATYTRVVADVNPWVMEPIIGPDPGTCDWNFHYSSFRIDGDLWEPGSWVCNGDGWTEPTDDTTSPGIVDAPLGSFDRLVRAYDGTQALPRIMAADGGNQTITVDGTTYDFYEFEIPRRNSGADPKEVVVLVMLKDLDMFTPKPSEASFLYPSTIVAPGELLYGPTEIKVTGIKYEKWGDCSRTSSTTGNCMGLRPHIRYRATVAAGLKILSDGLVLDVRTRAAPSSELDLQPNYGDGNVNNPADIIWSTAEPKYPRWDNTRKN